MCHHTELYWKYAQLEYRSAVREEAAARRPSLLARLARARAERRAGAPEANGVGRRPASTATTQTV